jgi:chromosomal replication initiator protein
MNRPTVERIQRTVAQHYGIGLYALLGDSRKQDVRRARHHAMYLARRLLVTGRFSQRHSYKALAHRFERKDHTTILHAVRKVERQLPNDKQAQIDLAQIINRLNGIGE